MSQAKESNRQTSNLRDRTGNGLPNTSRDILWVKEAPRRLGRYNHGGAPHPYIDRTLNEAILNYQRDHHGGAPHPYIDRTLNEAILNYQRDRGLRRDGYLAPGGETECALCVELARLLGRARR